jgi:type IV secretion system protein VirB9
MCNLVINTDRRTYLLELRSAEKTYMASVSWQYPQDQLIALRQQNASAEAATPIVDGVDISRLRFRCAIEGDKHRSKERVFLLVHNVSFQTG